MIISHETIGVFMNGTSNVTEPVSITSSTPVRVLPNQLSLCLAGASLTRSSCHFARFCQILSISISLFLFAPQLAKLRRHRSGIASGISVLWLILAANACLADIPFYLNVRSTYSGFVVFGQLCVLTSVIVALAAVLIFNSSDLYFSDRHYRPIVAGFSLASFASTILFSSINRPKSTLVLHWFGMVFDLFQFYPQMLLSILINTPKAISISTITLYIAKHSSLWLAMFIFTAGHNQDKSAESPNHLAEFSLLYMTVLMDFATFIHCFAVGRERRHSDVIDITRTQFFSVPKHPSRSTTIIADQQQQQHSRHTNMDLFSIDDSALNTDDHHHQQQQPRSTSGVYMPTTVASPMPQTSIRRGGAAAEPKRKQRSLTITAILKYTCATFTIASLLLLNIGFFTRITRFVAIFPLIAVVCILTSLFMIPRYLPENAISKLKMFL